MNGLLVLLVCTLGGFAAGMTSFGYAMICMLLMSMFLGVKVATIVTLMTSFAVYFAVLYQSLYKARVRISLKMMFIPLLGSMVGRYSGAKLFDYMSNEALMISLCIFMIVLNGYLFFVADKIQIRATTVNGLSAGFISGFFGGLNNIGGPPLVVYMYTVEDDRIKFTTYLQLIFFVGALTSLSVQISAGNVNSEILKYSAFGTVGVIAGTTLGYYFFKRLDQERLTKLIKQFILYSSIWLIIKTVADYIIG